MNEFDGLSVEEALLLIEASDQKKQFLATRYKVDPEIINQLDAADPTHGTFLEWLTRCYLEAEFTLPEDAGPITELLTSYAKLKNSPQIEQKYKDINYFKEYGQLAQFVMEHEDDISQAERDRARSIKGQEIVYNHAPYEVLKVTTPEAGAALFRGTQWCVKDPRFFNQYGPPFYMILKDGKPYVLIHRESAQAKNIYDDSIDPLVADNLQSFIHTVIENLPLEGDLFPLHTKDTALEYAAIGQVYTQRKAYAKQAIARNLVHFSMHILGFRFPEAEEYILEDSIACADYAEHVLHQRWPDAEHIIALDSHAAFNYAKYVIGGPWPEGEAAIQRNKDLWRMYNERKEIIWKRNR